MNSKVNPIPEGYNTVTAYACIKGAEKAMEFYARVFGAVERERISGPDGLIGHAEIKIGDTVIMLSDEHPAMNVLSPASVGGSTVMFMIYVADVDAVVATALAGGATLVRPVEDQFYGDRSGQILDPFGYRWNVATHIEDLSSEELQKRAAAMYES